MLILAPNFARISEPIVTFTMSDSISTYDDVIECIRGLRMMLNIVVFESLPRRLLATQV